MGWSGAMLWLPGVRFGNFHDRLQPGPSTPARPVPPVVTALSLVPAG